MPEQSHEHLIIAVNILESLGFPKAQLKDLCGYVLLALCGIGPNSSWSEVSNKWIRIHDIIQFLSEQYNKEYAENSRETIRKEALHHFRMAAIIEDNGVPTNSPNYRYRITDEFLALLTTRDTVNWKHNLDEFIESHSYIISIYESKRKMQKIPILINGNEFSLSLGNHNELQKAILEEFAPRFAPVSKCLYIGDTQKKDLYKDDETLRKLGFQITVHEKMPDIVIYKEDKEWIYFIEAVTSVGPMDTKRIMEINTMTQNVKAGKIFVTAFLDMDTYKKFVSRIAWETEVWIASMPDHLIHMNGNKFLGPR